MRFELIQLQAFLDEPAQEVPENYQAYWSNEKVASFWDEVPEASPESLDNAIVSIADGLLERDAYKACFSALQIGALVENGGAPELAFGACLDLFEKLLPNLNQYRQDPDEALQTENTSFAAGKGVNMLILALVTMGCRSVQNRRMLQSRRMLIQWFFQEEVEEVAGFENLFYLQQIVKMIDGRVTVLFPQYHTGVIVEVEAVANNFHLFTLLQSEIVKHARPLGLQKTYSPTDETLLHVATGQIDAYNHSGQLPNGDAALFYWFQYTAYLEDPTFQGVPIAHFAWGEGSPRENAQLNNRMILLAKEETEMMQRSWSLSFVSSIHSAHKAAVRIDKFLQPTEVEKLLQEILALP